MFFTRKLYHIALIVAIAIVRAILLTQFLEQIVQTCMRHKHPSEILNHLGKKCFRRRARRFGRQVALSSLNKSNVPSLHRFIGAALPWGWTYFRKQRLVRPPCPFLSSTLMAMTFSPGRAALPNGTLNASFHELAFPSNGYGR